LIAMFVFEKSNDEIAISLEKHYRLVASDAISADELKQYQSRSDS